MKGKIQQSFYRWVSLIYCGIVAAVAWVVLEAFTSPAWDYLSNALSTIPVAWLLPSIGILVLALCWPAAHTRWWAFLGLRHPLRYPPIWVAVITTILTLTVPIWFDGNLWSSLHQLQYQSFWWAKHTHPFGWLFLCFELSVLVIISVLDKFSYPKVLRPVPPEEQSFRTIQCHDDLIRWAQTDDPISCCDEDAFGRASMASRVARRFTEAIQKRQPPQAMTILGPQGAGKSSLLSLVEEELTPHQNIEIVGLSLWPYDSPEGAIAGILDAMRDAIGQHASTLALTRIRSNYIDAMAQAGSTWGAFTHLLRSDESPEQIVRRFNNIAKAIDVHFVLWLEDIERYANEDHLTDKTEAEKRQVERLTSVYALLYLLDECDAITVVISTDSLRIRFDRQKITRFVERIPTLKLDDVWSVVRIMREHCLNADDIIDPATEEHRKWLSAPVAEIDPTSHLVWSTKMNEAMPRIHFAIVELLNTPRMLKSVINQVHEAWGRLRGEIDFDDLFVVSVLRASAPDVYALVEDHVSRFQSGSDKARSSSSQASADFVGDELREVLEGYARSNLRREAAIKSCVEFVFPNTFKEHNAELILDHLYQNPQGLLGENGGVSSDSAWERYINHGIADPRLSDQQFLREIQSWKATADASNTLIKWTVDNDRVWRVLRFQSQFDYADLCMLLEHVVLYLSTQDRERIVLRSLTPGLFYLKSMFKRSSGDVTVLTDTLLRIFERHTNDCLWLVCLVVENIVKTGFLNKDKSCRERVQNGLAEAMEKYFCVPEGAMKIIKSLPTADWRSFDRCMCFVGYNENRPGGRLWADIRGKLVDLAMSEPHCVLPVLLPRITSVRRSSSGELARQKPATFEENDARRCYGVDYESLIQALSESPAIGDEGSELRARAEAARDYAVLHSYDR